MAKTICAKLVEVPLHDTLTSHEWRSAPKRIGILFNNGMLALLVGSEEVRALVMEHTEGDWYSVLDEDVQVPFEIYDALASEISGHNRLKQALPKLLESLRTPASSGDAA